MKRHLIRIITLITLLSLTFSFIPSQSWELSRIQTASAAGTCRTTNYYATTDTYLHEGNPTTNYGASTTLDVRNTQAGDARHALLRWDLTGLPPGSQVTSASITLYVQQTTNRTYNLYQMRRNWVENQATWNIWSTGFNWTTAGARNTTDDRYDTNLWGADGTTFNATGARTASLNANGLAVVQGWINTPTNNLGVTIQNYDDNAPNNNHLIFRSANYDETQYDPILTLTYCPDWGDLPDTYLTTAASNGAGHILYPDANSDNRPESVSGSPAGTAAIWLGAIVDTETDGLPDSTAVGDDNNGVLDEDGVELLTLMEQAGYGTIRVTFNSSNADQSGSGYLGAWFDWNSNGAFDVGDPYINQAVSWTNTTRTQSFNFNFTGSLPATIRARVRLFANTPAAPSTAYSGFAANGEVEDYAWPTTPTALQVAPPQAVALASAIQIEWQTYNEMDLLKFRLFRSTSVDGEKLLVYQAPANATGQPLGGVYQYLDPDVVAGKVYTYWLEATLRDGSVLRLAPTSASLPQPGYKVYLPAITR